jgi:ssDNA-binding Zn-finger/Zn-ribbon topoisomerase 1
MFNRNAIPKCPECGKGHLCDRTRDRDGHPFVGCDRYPRCRFAADGPMAVYLAKAAHLAELNAASPLNKWTPERIAKANATLKARFAALPFEERFRRTKEMQAEDAAEDDAG